MFRNFSRASCAWSTTWNSTIGSPKKRLWYLEWNVNNHHKSRIVNSYISSNSPIILIIFFTFGSSEGVGQTYPDGHSWQDPFPEMEYLPTPHNLGGPLSEQLKPAGQGAQTVGHAETLVLTLHVCVRQARDKNVDYTYKENSLYNIIHSKYYTQLCIWNNNCFKIVVYLFCLLDLFSPYFN